MMRKPPTVLIYSVGAILGAHGLAYLLVGALPQAAVSALGLFSANEHLLAAFAQSFPPRTYLDALGGLFTGDLGRTLDGQAVTSELNRALSESAPRLGASFLLLAGVCFMTAMWVRDKSSPLRGVGDFIAFLPPYVAPFLGLALLLAVQLAIGVPLTGMVYESVAVLSLSIGGGALLSAQTARITQRNLRSEYAQSIRAAGATQMQLRRRILHNLVAEIGPTFEKMVVGLTAALFFVEPILGLGGFGTLAARAVRRSDIDLILGVTLVVASFVAVTRILVSAIRVGYGMNE